MACHFKGQKLAVLNGANADKDFLGKLAWYLAYRVPALQVLGRSLPGRLENSRNFLDLRKTLQKKFQDHKNHSNFIGTTGETW